MTTDKTRCEICGFRLPLGVDRSTRRIRSAHFEQHANERKALARAIKSEAEPEDTEWAKTEAAFAHVSRVSGQADGNNLGAPWFYGWAVREAFIAGAEWQEKRRKS